MAPFFVCTFLVREITRVLVLIAKMSGSLRISKQVNANHLAA
ncbi:hypothetical protein HNQ99_001422 [Rhizorhapis suberifaciens]|uniref:Uncharacterized protein n=1 Tax=Rhizorhapis suberifaciens TaxID=13656 RepID=A0A840HU85_9SPHN|nr:hypothetical protein [Rhizorhapis suberifaciens]